MKRRDQFIVLALVFILPGLFWFYGKRSQTGAVQQQDAPVLLKDGAVSGAITPVTLSASPSPRMISASAEDVGQLEILNQIFKTRNDNDPRLDRELKVLSEGAKALMRDRYQGLQPEKRNERGTIVFLLGRNIASQDDLNFLCEVLREPPCLSLANCSGDPGSAGREDFEHESGEEVTLAYPQLVAAKSLEAYLAGRRATGGLSSAAFKALECAKDSRVSVVVNKAADIAKSLGRGF